MCFLTSGPLKTVNCQKVNTLCGWKHTNGGRFYPEIDLHLILKILQLWTQWVVNTFGNTTHLTFLCDWMIEWFKVNGVSNCTWGCHSSNRGLVSRGQFWPSVTCLSMHQQETVSYIGVWKVERSLIRSVKSGTYILLFRFLVQALGKWEPSQKRAAKLLFLVCVAANSWMGCSHNVAEEGELNAAL